MRKTTCRCAESFEAIQVFSYERAKKILNAAKHPTFIGRDLVRGNARNGGLFVFAACGVDAALAIVNPRLNVLIALSVIPAHQGHGLGSAALRYLQCNFARVESNAVPFFERNGFISIGLPKKGKTLYTQLMVRKSLQSLAGRVATFYGNQEKRTREDGSAAG